MANAPQPLSVEQQRLINIVKTAHQTLSVARKTKERELARRLAEAKIESDRQLELELETIKLDLDAEMQKHASNLDEAVIAAYENDVPIRRIALDGFGNRYDGAAQQMIVKLRADGRVGSSMNYQRNTTSELDAAERATVEFPKPVDVDGLINHATTVHAPVFSVQPLPLVLAEADANGDNAITVPGVQLDMDPRDPWFKQIEKNARPGTPYLRSTSATLYLHPHSGELIVHESKETGDVVWDHPVARWVKEHKAEATAGYAAALVGNDA
jgi:hypothetical protein